VKIRLPTPESVLHDSQLDVFRRLRRFNVLEIGRRWGKTKFEEFVILNDAIRGKRTAWFAPSYKYLAEPVRDLERALLPLISKHDRVEKRIELSTGGTIDFWTLEDADAGRGRFYDRVAIDEAGFVVGLLDIWRAAIRPTLADRKGSAIFAGTPKGTGDFHRLFLEAEGDTTGAWAAFRIGSMSNPFLDPAEVEAMRASLPKAIADQELEGIPAEDGGNPFGLDAIRACIAPMSAATPEAWGVDLAKSQDWTVAVGLDADGRVCRLERWQAPWNVTRERLAKMIQNSPAQIDSTGVGDPIVEDLRKVCRRTEGFKFTSQSKQQLMEGLQIAISTADIRFPDGWLRSELESFGFRYSGRNVSYEATVGHDDGVCALALAVLARRARRPLMVKVI
jgi:hypothetical protein